MLKWCVVFYLHLIAFCFTFDVGEIAVRVFKCGCIWLAERERSRATANPGDPHGGGDLATWSPHYCLPLRSCLAGNCSWQLELGIKPSHPFWKAGIFNLLFCWTLKILCLSFSFYFFFFSLTWLGRLTALSSSWNALENLTENPFLVPVVFL